MHCVLFVCMAFLLAGCATLSDLHKDPKIDGEKLFRALLMPVSLDKEQIRCYSFYLHPVGSRKNFFHSFMVSAGHCPAFKYATTVLVRDATKAWQTVRPFVLTINIEMEGVRRREDYFIGYIAEGRKNPIFFIVDEWRPLPDQNEQVITVAEPPRLDKDPTLQKMQFKEVRSDGLLTFEAEKEIQNSFSGAPVATTTGRLLGVLVAAMPGEEKLAIVMPIKRILEEIRRHLK